MRRELQMLAEELRRLKSEGVERVVVSNSSLQRLRALAASVPASADSGAREATRPPAPAPAPAAPATAAPEPRSGAANAAPKPESPAVPKTTLPPPPEVTLPEGGKQTRWEALREKVLGCPVCNEHVREGCRVVFGVGSLDADIFFVGEAPGADEEIQGEPFVGPAGELLTRMIQAMGLERSGVYIGNIMNWRPETSGNFGNRPPTQEEMRYCLPYLLAQIEIIRPKVLVALGATAVAGLFGPDDKRRMRDLRGRWHDFNGTPTMVTYHPSYVLRRNANAVKREVWEDMLAVMEKVGLPISDRQRNFFRAKQ